ncbi:MAG TPA: SurA N-terminal domain-containing protein [Pyrinomonadaceae bacterium]|nr:SurA N-terminal domain-containing protein [Pyrinomonadaceae bacterium]
MPKVFRQTATLAAVATILLALAACGRGPGGDKAKDVAATVNGKDILLSDVDRIINQQTQGQQLSPTQLAAARLQALDSLVQREALVLRAEKEKTVPTDDEVTTAINSQKMQMTAEEWEKFLKENNLTEQQLRDEAKKDLAINKLQEKLFGKITIREQEITDSYNSNPAQYVNPRGVALSDIVADPRDSGGLFKNDAKSEAEAALKINSIEAQLKTGADFATVARENSEDQSSVRGGDIGFANEDDLKQNNFPPDLVNRLFNTMKVGDITEPIHFPDGRWIIFKLTNRQLENKPLKLEDVHDQIKQALINQRQSILKDALISNAMSDVTVVNKLAESMLNDPNNLGGNQPVSAGATPSASPAQSTTPAANASPAANTPAATTTASPAAAKPTPAARPTAAATPHPQATHPAATTPGASPKR